ncbi:MAG: hypothetical protein IJ855_07605, partial [Bacteroidales bacterium]|nr:hypothetical protein [Bacteroidales bacterium]
LELEAGAALGYNDAKQYECGYCGTEIGKDKGWGVVPKLGLNLAYNFVKRKGMIDEVIRIPQPKAPANVSSPAAFNPVLSDVTPRKGIADEIAETNPFLKPIGQYKPYTPDRVLRKEKGALYVNFEVGKHILKYNFRNNGEVLDKIVDITSKVMADARNQVSKIQIVGLASIEGGYQLNQRLALNRAVALQKYLQERINIPDEMFDAQGGAEAWSEFKDQVNDLLLEGGNSELNPKELQQIIDIINSEGNLDRREAKIKSLNKGRTFQILKRHILADQRNSGYLVIYFDYVDEVAKKINSAIGMLESGNDKEALDVLQKVSDDPRSANALATALYKNGREAEAIALLEKAIAQGGEGAVGAKENLESIRSIQKQRAEYEQYQKDLQEYNKQMEDFNKRVNQLKQSK